ncbi:Maf family protein [Lacimonas salitolerans]|uniref:Nucleoside triphosphate pyrophosphatase n=1 Tax=Lacimonas salitolerans TaxID=1323750 RepID=A0ABW4EJL2_9RHOB
MPQKLILASGSSIRRQMLERAGVDFDVQVARVDEEMIRDALLVEQASPRDIADTLAEMKARKISDKRPGALVIGCDQVLSFDGRILSKPISVDDARDQLRALRGQRHQLLSAAVIVEDGQPIWRHVGTVRLMMREFSDTFLDGYLSRNWPGIGDSVGAYKLEEEGVRLFSRVEGDYFTVLGMPLLELLSYLTLRGDLQQ